VALPVVRSLVTLHELQRASPLKADVRANLGRRGIAEIYRSRRITVGKYRNFTPGEPV
jgi:hypothetical protein